jgi:two-component system response regulator (stage 0 sporulation protein A)
LITDHANERQMFFPPSPRNLEAEVTSIMHENRSTCTYKRISVFKGCNNNGSKRLDVIYSITKQLYPSIAREYNTTPSRVERAIRHAIEVAWSRGQVDAIDSLFGYTVNLGKGKPTNSEFIAMVADKLRLELKVS